HRRRSSLRLSGHLSALFQPCLIILRRINDDTALHTIMSETAKLPADHFVGAGLNRLKPHRNDRTGNRVLSDAHVRPTEIVNSVSAGQFNNNGEVKRNV